MKFYDCSIEEQDDGTLIWHFQCKECRRFFRTSDDIRESNGFKIQCPKCKNQLLGFISCKEIYKRYIIHSRKLSANKSLVAIS